MNFREIRNASLVELSNAIDEIKSKEELNIIIFEIACRIYVPFSEVSFDELLLSLGYLPKEQEKAAQKHK